MQRRLVNWAFGTFGALVCGLVPTLAQEQLIFEQSGDVQRMEHTYDAGGFSYRMVGDDFVVWHGATLTRLEVQGGYPEGRVQPLSEIVVTIFVDVDGFPDPDRPMYTQSFRNPDKDMDGDMELNFASVSLEGGEYWLCVFERFAETTPDPPAWSWKGGTGVTFGHDYVVTEGLGPGPGTWGYSNESGAQAPAPGRLYFRLYGVPAGERPVAPRFITPDFVWKKGDGSVEILLPHPNSDGFFSLPSTQLAYEISITVDCTPRFTQTVTPDSFPYLYTLPVSAPAGPYQIRIARGWVDSNKRDMFGEAQIISGPSRADKNEQISTEVSDIDRWLFHVPRVAGGFEGTIVFSNPFPELPAVLWVAGFDAFGEYVSGTQTGIAVIGQKAELLVYDDGSGKQALFDAAFTDEISHLGLFEANGKKTVQVSMTYQSLTPGALSASVNETDLALGGSVGSSFVMDARESDVFWDGVALLNLTGNTESRVFVSQRRTSDHGLLGRIQIASVAPGAKNLQVISDLFPFTPGTYYTIDTGTTMELLQVVGLRGTLPPQSPLLVSSSIAKTR